MLVDDFYQYHAQDDTFGGRISLARESAMQTIEEAADQLGVTPQIWMDWECDRAAPESYHMPLMIGILGISLPWLVAGQGSGPTPFVSASDVNAIRRELHTATVDAVRAQNRVQELLRQLQNLDLS
ncbi:transcriptional regulator [Phyllobacterium sp. LjRoot231]|uniref:helix-turn-helix domain-containing protein n=1 Tax=Phyllobacterium sp. LjRoot231 TaxID=3342289 RepID=UPI003ECEC455